MKRTVLFLAGGKSGEHEVSLISAKHVLSALDRDRYDALLLIIQKNGEMTLCDEKDLSHIANNPKLVQTPQGPAVSIRPYLNREKRAAIVFESQEWTFDVAFPILHGTGGEDGTVQGLFELAGIALVGCGVKASAICMDKAMTKRLCQYAGLPVVPFIELYKGQELTEMAWKFPVFVKPAQLGSSLGVSKVRKPEELKKALSDAFVLDSKVLVEPAIEGREIEFAVLGKRNELTLSPAGEIRMTEGEFYSYEAKYVLEKAAELILPASLPTEHLTEGQKIAAAAFNTLECHGLARIDFFYTPDGKFLLNEVNTIPGFTPISMYPKLLQLAGISYSSLITKLIDLAS